MSGRLVVLAVFLALVTCLAPVSPASATSTVVFSTDFESGIPAELSAPGSVLTGVQGWAGLGPPGRQFSGQFLRYTTVSVVDTWLVLRNLPPHDSVDIGFLLALIDSWDGTELMRVDVDGILRFSHWFQLATGDTSDYPPPPGALLSAGHNLGFSNGGYYFRDRAYNLAAEPAFQAIPHTADSLKVRWYLGATSGSAAQNWQGGDDESWALDGVTVTVNNSAAGVGPFAPGRGLMLAGAEPNPSSGARLAIRLALPSAEPATLQLFDLSGRRVLSRDVGSFGPGSHLVKLPEGAGLAPGIYHVRVTQAGETRAARIVLMD